MRWLLKSCIVGIVPLVFGGCLVSLDESLWQNANADNGPVTDTTDAQSIEQQAPDAVVPDVENETTPPPDATTDTPSDAASDMSPDAASDLPLDLPLDVAPPPDIAPDQCVDQCTVGATRCHSQTAMQSCEPAPSGGCLTWGLPTTCGANEACTSDQCALTCTNQCNPGERRCVSLTSAQRCQMTSTGCYDWATPEGCDWNKRCFSGLCLLICTTNGIPMPCDPLSAQGGGCFEGNCYITGNGPACVCPVGTVPSGGDCEFGTDCEPAHVCVGLQSPGVCRPMCDPLLPSCAVGNCIPIENYTDKYGYCEP